MLPVLTQKWHKKLPLARVVQAGAVPMDTAAVCSGNSTHLERPDAEEWAKAYEAVFPEYQLLIESYLKSTRS